MRVTRAMLKSMFVCISLLGVSANGTLESTPTPAVNSAAIADSSPDQFGSPLQRPRSTTDLWLMGLVAITLVGHQMRRKHRFLRPHPFGL